jgi:hypothetical protein
MGGRVILMPPCLFCMEDPYPNIQGRMRMASQPGAAGQAVEQKE